MGTEATTQAAIIAALQRRGAWVHKNHQGGYGRRGIPDLSVCYRGTHGAVEVKADRAATVRPEQLVQLHAIQHAGGWALIAWDVDQIERALDLVDAHLDAEQPPPRFTLPDVRVHELDEAA